MRERTHAINRRFMGSLLIGTGSLIQIAEQAWACRDIESLKRAGAMLRELPGVDQSQAGLYYTALARVCSGDRARAMLESVVENGSDFYRIRALSALGTDDYRAGRLKEAKRFYLEALGRNEKAGDLLTTYYTQHNLAVIESDDGNHVAALGRLQNIEPLMRLVGRSYPAHYYDYLHGLSVELYHNGHARAAQEALGRVLASPYAFAYPEWLRSKDYISQPLSRSRIAIASALPVSDNQARVGRFPLAMNIRQFKPKKREAIEAFKIADDYRESKDFITAKYAAYAKTHSIEEAQQFKQYIEDYDSFTPEKREWIEAYDKIPPEQRKEILQQVEEKETE